MRVRGDFFLTTTEASKAEPLVINKNNLVCSVNLPHNPLQSYD